ncbi:MAG TPA: hypothetical protein VEZ42_05245 [Pseudonocardia sp.]|jgi:hypothetical protein|nr:hypothetical protein [Pseudonocardia sp.]
MDRTTALRTLRDVGAAAWFGGSLMGASGLNAAADEVDPADRDRIASAGWARWTPIFRAAAAAHLIGSLGVLAQSRSKGAALGLGLTTAALGATLGTAKLGASDASTETIHKVEWAIPALLAGVVALGARRSD